MQKLSAERSGGNRDNKPKRNLPSSSKGTGGNSGKKTKSDNNSPKEATKEVKESGSASSRDGSQNNATGFSKLLVKTKIYFCPSFTKQMLSIILVLSFI
jgi:hypothetical protein